MAITTIDVPAALTKADLYEVCPYRGVLNATAMCLNGTEYPPGTVVFTGFAGSCKKADDKFRGHYKFRPAQASDGERDAQVLTELPQFVAVLVTTEPSILDDGAGPDLAQTVCDAVNEPKPRKKRPRKEKANGV